MKRFKEYMDEMTTQGWITFITIALLALIIIVGGVLYYVKHPNTWPLTYFTSEQQEDSMDKRVLVKSRGFDINDRTLELINQATDATFSKTENNSANKPVETQVQIKPVVTFVEAVKPVSKPVSYQYQKEEVKIALIMAKNEYDVTNVISGVCGDVYMVTAFVPGPTVLTNSMKALFGNKIYGDFLPGNVIPTYHPNLSFEDVVITNGVAKIYLSGSFETAQGSCNTELALAQLQETSKSYPNVVAVEIYQNGQKIN